MSGTRRHMKGLFLTAALLAVASVCGAESGTVKICRTTRGLDSSYLHKPVKLPAGMRFVDAGVVQLPTARNAGRPVQIALVADVTIKDSNQCVVVGAEVIKKPENYRILRSGNRLFRPDFIDNRADFLVTIDSDFQ